MIPIRHLLFFLFCFVGGAADKLMKPHIIRLSGPQVSKFFTTMSPKSPASFMWNQLKATDGSVWFLGHLPD